MLLLDEAHLHESSLITRLECWISLNQVLKLENERAQFDRTLIHVVQLGLE